jgi:hypothetical protein
MAATAAMTDSATIAHVMIDRVDQTSPTVANAPIEVASPVVSEEIPSRHSASKLAEFTA